MEHPLTRACVAACSERATQNNNNRVRERLAWRSLEVLREVGEGAVELCEA